MKASEIIVHAQKVIELLEGMAIEPHEKSAVMKVVAEAGVTDWPVLAMPVMVSARDRASRYSERKSASSASKSVRVSR